MGYLNIPIINFFNYNINEISDPSGTRHLEGANFAFKQKLALGCSKYSGPGTSGTLSFQGLKFDTSSPQSHLSSRIEAIVIALGSSGVAIVI